ncbi:MULTISPECIES: GNAT family N-acetyltransferase [unclassified Acidisoma]|jgi:ribosomal-protein-alanine N-acetyltransferase|uniref:GNAT family N-acetyltransferase n=1 Tax=unclassified Acidisoma TaxID=2634065 RepID=UPI00131E2821|nr:MULTISPECIES: GNAT family N-acetyltransferase [unclassified Acidisoma]
MTDVVLETPRLRLRRFELADVPALHLALSDPDVMRYWSNLPHETEAQTRTFVETTIAAVVAGDSDDFVITQDGVVIGKAGLWQGSEIGFFLSRSHWGRGLAREALQAVIGRAFARDVTAITADIDPRNDRSLRLLLSLGFEKTGEAQATFRVGEVWTDSVYLALPAPDPLARSIYAP